MSGYERLHMETLERSIQFRAHPSTQCLLNLLQINRIGPMSAVFAPLRPRLGTISNRCKSRVMWEMTYTTLVCVVHHISLTILEGL